MEVGENGRREPVIKSHQPVRRAAIFRGLETAIRINARPDGANFKTRILVVISSGAIPRITKTAGEPQTVESLVDAPEIVGRLAISRYRIAACVEDVVRVLT